MGLKEKYKSAREKSKEITQSIVKPSHLGKHSFETITQELISLSQTKPMFRDKDWNHKARGVRAGILNLISDGNRKAQRMILVLNQVEDQR